MNTCIDCTFWSMWDGSCCHVDHDWAIMDADSPACPDFELNVEEMELRKKEIQK